MSKKCEHCGASMPDEAHFCLSCFTAYGESAINDDNNKKLGGFTWLKSKLFGINKKRFALIATALLSVVLIIGFSLYSESDAIRLTDKPSNKTAVSSTTNDDGSVITTYDDGSVETKTSDGTTITEEADGTVVTETPDGIIVTEKTDGTVVTKKTDGTVVTEKADGTVVTEKPDGTKETENPDGTTITEKPDGTVETKNPDGTTETKKPDGTTETKKPDGTIGSTDPTETTTTATKPTSPSTSEPTTENTTSTTKQENTSINYDDFTFEYKTNYGVTRLYITKYTGKDEVVSVPYSYNGDYIYEISINAIVRNKYVKKIIFNATDDHAPYIHELSVYQCDNLEEIVYNWSNYNSPYVGTKTIDDRVAGACPNIKSIKVNGSNYYTVYKNGLYYNKDALSYPNDYVIVQAWGAEWHQPSWCNKVDAKVFESTTELKEIYINPTKYTFSSLLSGYLEAVHIDKSNQEYFDDNGVVYSILTKECSFYPSKRRDESYTFLDGYTIKNEHSLYATYSYIKTIYIPKNFRFNTEYGKKFLSYSNLDTVYIENGNPAIDFIKENFKGNVIIY